MKIADLKKKENNESIYQLILEANKINENYILLREVILKDEAQYEDTVTSVPRLNRASQCL